MPKPQNPNRTLTTIGGVPKSLVIRIRKYARSDQHRSGTESTASILERIISEYETDNTPPHEEAPSTY